MGSRACAVIGATVIVATMLVGLAVPALAGEPTAVQKDTARSLMQDGRDLRDAKDLKGALQRFQAADEIMRVPPTGFEVANTQADLGMLVEARDTIARVLNIPASPKEPAQFKQAREKARALDDSLIPRIPMVTVTVKGGSNATLTIDDVEVPAALVGLPVRVNPGHHTLGAKTADAHGTRSVDVAEGDKKEVTIELVGQPADATPATSTAPQPPPAAETPSRGGSYAPAIVAFGVAGAGLVVGGITGGLTLAKQSDLARLCPKHTCGPGNYGDIDTANMLATISTVSFIAAGVSAAAGLVLFFVGKPSSGAPTTARLTPWIGIASAGVSGRF